MQYTREWIDEIRGDMTKEAFRQHIYRFKNNGKECVNVHRNSLRNWESGKTELPRDVETFLSLALLYYDQHHEPAVTAEQRNERYRQVREWMKEVLGVDLYCRHLHDALLIQVCRGLITFPEVVPLEKELEEALNQVKRSLTKEKLDFFAIERSTIRVSEDLNHVESVEELKEAIALVNRNTFAAANRTIGARLEDIYNERQRYSEKVPLSKAIANLAPNYRDSYHRMNKSSFISRDWMLDLCIHLRFNREEINRVLESAHMAVLSDKPGYKEYYIRETEHEIGCAAWYCEIRKNHNAYFAAHFSAFMDMSLADRLKSLLLIGIYLRNKGNAEYCPPIDYILESFTFYDYGSDILKKVDEILEKAEEEGDDYENWEDDLSLICFDTWGTYLDSAVESKMYHRDLYHKYKKETPAYYRIDPAGKIHTTDPEQLELLRCFAALAYTILTGEYYPGHLYDQDLQSIRNQLPDKEGMTMNIYRFLSHFLGIFLGNAPVHGSGKTGFYVAPKAGEKRRSMSMDQILEDLWYSALYMNHR